MNFDDFDYSVFLNPEYKEDAVREDLVSPFLKKLGYAPTGDNLMVRSRSLTHPYVYIGTKKNKVNIIPDYLLEINGEPKWILDAKAPEQNIINGKNVEQAFSYAIHPDVRADLYALCNGKQLTVFKINKIQPILNIKLEEWENSWDEIYKCLSPTAISQPHLLGFKPDLGLYMLKAGAPIGQAQHFMPMGIPMIGKVEDDLYTICVNIDIDDGFLATSFDFDEKRYQQLLKLYPHEIGNKVKNALKRQPYQLIFTPEETIEVNIHAELGKTVHSNDNEDYCPLWVNEFS
ncbi:type I restriction enzyme HsdR N-terminal domain-containing protein [Thalassotalea fonticola]|uniref:Type I restriction enzyme HsdR N-terminal domain-containing protein n=1 Tax=Thalassotalea fonticola TaxID=3065649 RepID=A0ABZ0GP12_9GAMM|nr:type I restriction enzyme HsdR N-terminal domain-containing protein [Colwelliaceae bacterium S1-1]